MGQFALPLAVLGVGVVGLMLLGNKKSTTAAPDSMPKLNSAIRGTPIPVTFGTNKLSSQIPWAKNYNAVRQQSSGKGKGGGSGGFGSAKGGGAAGQEYLYYWDMMFNFGIADQPSMIRRGWVGGDTITDLSIAALTSGLSSDLIALIPPSSLTSDQSAALSYTAAFIAPGYPTADPDLTTWPFFQAQEGVNCAFPYTMWVGFDQLNLGQTPSVPQLFFEWVPISAVNSFTTNGGFLTATGHNSADPSVSDIGFLTDANGLLYTIDVNVDGDAAIVTEINGATSVGVTKAQINTALTGAGLDTYSSNVNGAFPVGGSYFYTFGYSAGGSPIIAMYTVNTDGTLTFMGAGEYTGSFSAAWLVSNTYATGVLASGEIAILFDDSSGGPRLLIVHGPATFASGGSFTFNELDLRAKIISELNSAYFMLPGTNQISSNLARASFIGGKLYFYISKSEMDWANSHSSGVGFNTYVKSICTMYPNGILVRVDVAYTGVVDYTFIGPVSEYGFPYADVQLNSSGAAGTADDDYTVPALTNSIVLVTRRYSDDLYQAKVFAYDPLTQGLQGFYQGVFSNSGNYSGNPVHMRAIYDGSGNIYLSLFPYGTVGQVVASFAAITPNAIDVTPAYVIYRILTNEAFGFATGSLFGFTISEDRINTLSYLAAVAECERQGCYISVTYDNASPVLNIITDLLALYNGFLTENDGIISFGFVQAAEASVRTLDNDHLVGSPPVQVTKAALDDGYNKVIFNYLDRSLDYNQNQVIQEDPVDQDLNGPRVRTWDTKFVMAGSLATQIANRALWANLYGRDGYVFKTGWKDADLRPGQVVTIVDSFDPNLSNGAKIRLINRKASDNRGTFEWNAIQEYDYIVAASTSFTQIASVPTGYGSLITSVSVASWQTAYELPREFQGSKAELYFGYGQSAQVMGAQLHLSNDGASFILAQDQQPYVLSGRFAAALEARPKGYVDDLVEFYIFQSNTFSVATPSYFQNYALDDITPATRAAGGGVVICGSEAISFETLTLLGQNHYRARRAFRGWGGSPISAHGSGTVFHAHGGGVFNHEITQDDIGTTLYYKIAPYNFAGTLVDISSVPIGTYSIQGLFWLPREQPRTKFWVASAVSWPASLEVTGPYLGVTSGGVALTVTWSKADNAEGYGAGGYGAGGYGHFISADSVNWRVDVMSKNGVAVGSAIVNTPYFGYTVAQNSQDFNGFGRDLVVKVTPFTVKGDGPVSDVRSISLNW